MADVTARGPVQLGVMILVLGMCAAVLCVHVAPLGVFVLRVLAPLALALPAALAAVGACFAARRALVRFMPAAEPAEPALLSICEAFLLGMPLFGTLCFLVACVSCSVPALSAPLLGCAGLGAYFVMVALRRGRDAPPVGWPAWLCVVVSLCLAVAVLVAQLPPFTLDEVAYHLAVPKAWLIEGHVVELPLNSHSYFPNGIESVVLPLLALAGEQGAIAFHFLVLGSFAALLCSLGGWLRTHDASGGPWLAVAATATTPALLMTSGTGWIDAPLLGLAIVLCRAVETAWRSDERHPLGAVVLAVAAGCLSKYTWAFVLVAAFGAAGVTLLRHPRHALRLVAAGFAGVALGGVYFVRNLVWTGNPVAPFLAPRAPHVEAFNAGNGAIATLLNYVHDPIMVDESIGVLLPALVVAFVLAQAELGEHRFARALGGFATMVVALLAALGAAGRLLVPFLCLVAGPGAVALARGATGEGSGERPSPLTIMLRRLSTFAVGTLAVLQVAFVATMVAQYRPFSVLSGNEGAELARLRPTLKAAAWLDSQLPAHSRTLVIGIHESYWFDRPVRCAGNFDGPRVRDYLQAPSALALHEKLRRDGFTHLAIYGHNVIVGDRPSSGRRAEAQTTLDPATAGLLRSMLNEHARKLGEDAGAALLAL